MTAKEMMIETMQGWVKKASEASGISNESMAMRCIIQAMEEADKIARQLVEEFGMTYKEVELLQIV